MGATPSTEDHSYQMLHCWCVARLRGEGRPGERAPYVLRRPSGLPSSEPPSPADRARLLAGSLGQPAGGRCLASAHACAPFISVRGRRPWVTAPPVIDEMRNVDC